MVLSDVVSLVGNLLPDDLDISSSLNIPSLTRVSVDRQDKETGR